MSYRVHRLITILAIFISSTLLAQAPDTLWTKSIGGAFDEMFNSVEPIPGGGFILAGHREFSLDPDEEVRKATRAYWLARLNIAGDDTLWTKAFANDTTADGKGTEGRMAIATSDGGFGIIGSGDPRVIKTDGDGVLQWQLTEAQLVGGIQGIEETANGDLIACGVNSVGGTTSATVARITAGGTVLWERTYSPPYDSYLTLNYRIEHWRVSCGRHS